ncbi:MAG: hypothetical protein AB8B64_21440 [Granulosicoccus sp.]
MQLRRFTAESTPAALGAVRLALGDDAIILANRKIGDQVEIIATGQMEDAESLAEISLENVSQQQPSHDSQGYQRGATPMPPGDDLAGTTKESSPAESTTIEALTAAINAEENKATAVKPVQADGAADSAAATSARKNDAYSHAPIHLTADKRGNSTAGSLQSSNRQGASGKASQPSRSDNSSLLDLDNSFARHTEQLAQIIEAQGVMINQYFKGLEVNLWGNSAPNRTLHLQKLFGLGIGAELAIQLVERADPEHSVEDALRQSFALLKSTLPIGVDKTFSVPGVTILSGPPGAGKTTVLMKIATQHVKESGNDSIVIICADTRRIGAFEELQAYGRLLGVPTVHAHDSSELDSLLNAFTHKQLVLIDHTLPMDVDAVEIPKRLLKPTVADSVRQLLVLSATVQSATVDALIRRHCEGRSMQCVLTHLDASARLGEMFNAIIRHHLPIAYWSDAASIQNPLQKADASVLIATAVAMSRRLQQTPDDEWLLRLIQPSDKMMSQPVYKKPNKEVSA